MLISICKRASTIGSTIVAMIEVVLVGENLIINEAAIIKYQLIEVLKKSFPNNAHFYVFILDCLYKY